MWSVRHTAGASRLVRYDGFDGRDVPIVLITGERSSGEAFLVDFGTCIPWIECSDRVSVMAQPQPLPGVEIVDFADIAPTLCPCGSARRAFADVGDYPATLHVTEISEDAKLHYHKRLTETYFFLECEPDARMQLDDQIVPVKSGMSILIRPGVRHRAIGRMKVLIVVLPKFDPVDEWFDEQ